MITIKYFILYVVFVVCFSLVHCEYAMTTNEEVESTKELGRELVEQGRTLVHHAMKRFMIILPAIFFKLGVAFTLLLLVTVVAVNNGFIGFMLLVVGLSTVLARLQDARGVKPLAAPIPIPLAAPHYAPHFAHIHHGWDRKDDGDIIMTKSIKSIQQQQQPDYLMPSSPSPYTNYYGAYNYNYGRR